MTETLDRVFDEILDKKDIFSFSKKDLEIAIDAQIRKVTSFAVQKSPVLMMVLTNLYILLSAQKRSCEKAVFDAVNIYLSNDEHKAYYEDAKLKAVAYAITIFDEKKILERSVDF